MIETTSDAVATGQRPVLHLPRSGVPQASAAVPQAGVGVSPVRDGVPQASAAVPPASAGGPPVRDGVSPVRDGVPQASAAVPPASAGGPPVRDGVPQAGVGVATAGAGVVRAAKVVGYAALFTLLLPVLLVAWMLRLDALVSLRPIHSLEGGSLLMLAGLALAAAAIIALWRFGRGLPMSPFPPERLVTRGAYALAAHPLYVGSVTICAGAAIVLGSAAGLWIVTPVFAMSAAAFVLGFERDATRRRYGRDSTPQLSLPRSGPGAPTRWERAAVYLLVLLPWLVLYEAVEYLGAPRAAWTTYLALDASWPVVPWTEAIYVLAYPFVMLAPALAARRDHLRQFAIAGLLAVATIIPFYLLVPLVAAAKPVPLGSAWNPLLLFERAGDAPVTAFPAFHVVWVCIAAEVYAGRWPRLRWPLILFAAAIGASCVTTGMHSLLDVLGGVAAYAMLRGRSAVWLSACRLTEAVANSWHERTIGPVRFLHHGLYAAVGAALGTAAGVAVAGPRMLWWILATTIVAEAGAAAWAQVVEGSTQLLRPYGYFGGVIGVLLMALVAWAEGTDPWLLLGAMAVAGCVTQPLGRLRCLVQGCCHGRPTDAAWGIRYTHPRSRVLRLSDLGHRRLHPTPLYSIVSTLVVGIVLVRLWTLAVPLPLIGGTYLLLIGLARFVEEHYRGEPQTAWLAGLRLYQWLAVAFVVAGAVVTSIGGAPAPTPAGLDPRAWPALLALGLLTYIAYGVDFPRSNRKFSRLV